MTENEIAKEVVDSAIEVHRALGPGLLEKIYEKCLLFELEGKGLKVLHQVELPVVYKGEQLDFGFRADLVVEGKFIVEIKACENLTDVHLAQTLTYLKLADMKLGMLINFNVALLKYGIKRVINGSLVS
jgi:GxxExxY protein